MSETAIPFPALTPAQRLHLEIYGYVIIENVLTSSQVDLLKDTIYAIEEDFRRTGELPGPNCFNTGTSQTFFRIDNLPHLAPCFFDYLTHPLIVGIAEEIIGGPARLSQSDAHIRRPLENHQDQYGFHRTINQAYYHYGQGLYHFSFVKALTNLTDPGPDDGGTTVIAGTHSCSDPPQGFARWSLRLLADRLVELDDIDSVSHETIGQVLKKMKLNLGFVKGG